MPIRKTTPEKRAKRQLAALRATTHRTVKALAKDPKPQRAAAIMDWHEQQVEKIVSPRRKPQPLPPPDEFCWTCGQWHPRPIPQEWHLPVALQWPLAIGITAVFFLVYAFYEWWGLWVFPAGWLVLFSFFWSFVIPAALLLVVSVFLGATGIRF
jgi:hypothetical protein